MLGQASGAGVETRPVANEVLPSEKQPFQLSRTDLNQEISRTIHPILFGALNPLAAYFAAIILLYYFLETPLGFRVMAPLSAITAAFFLLGRVMWFSEYKSIAQLEVITLFTGLLVYINIHAFLYFHPEPSRLSYFIIFMLCLVTMSPTLRVVIAGAIICMGTMVLMAYRHGPQVTEQFVMLAVAACFAAFGVLTLMRKAISNAVESRLTAEEMQKLAQDQAHHDALTGLPNRRIFFAELEDLLQAPAPQPFALAIIDLDGFKPINDLYGHRVGDRVLSEVGERLKQVFRTQYMIARLGGDEFSVLFTRPLSDEELSVICRDVIAALQKPLLGTGSQLTVSASIGIARYPDHGQKVTEIYEKADHALYVAKSSNRGDVVIFNDRHEMDIRNSVRLERALKSADLENELYVVFQPQVDTVNDRIAGFEALARWESPELGLVSPGIFIPSAERCGMIETVTEIVLRKILATIDELPAEASVAINLSAHEVTSGRSADRILGIVQQSGVDPRRLEFELTETAIMTDFETACASLRKLSDIGCRIALDDFGAGYSCFNYIHRFPLDKIKIDRSFVSSLTEGAIGYDIIRAIVGLCRNLGYDCLVEGVETAEQLDAVKASGARFVQGYYFSRPIGLREVAHFVERFEAAAAANANAATRAGGALKTGT